jgi:hypothetical protein
VISPGYPAFTRGSTLPSPSGGGDGGEGRSFHLEGSPGQHWHDEPHEREPAKLDRWLVGLLAGAALMYLAGKVIGLGRPRPAITPRSRER